VKRILDLLRRIEDLENSLELCERKADILTNLLKEASAEFEQALEKTSVSEANFRALFENAPEAIFIIDTDHYRILDCNPFSVHWLGYSREELLAMRYVDIVTVDENTVRESIHRAIHHGRVKVQDRRFVKEDGTVVDAEVTGTASDYQGRPCLVVLVRDVTEKRKAQDALRRSEQRFRDIATYVPDWIWEVDHRWVYTYSSAGARKIVGVEARDVIGKPFWHRLPDDEKGRVISDLKEIARLVLPFSLYESCRIHRNGRLVHMESSGMPLLDEAGRLTGYRGIHRDVTERKRLEELTRYKELFENVADPVFINDFRGWFLEVNDVVCERFGYSRHELLQRAVKDLVPPEQLHRVSETGEAIKAGETLQFELEMITRQGERIPFEFHARRITYRGRPAVLGVARDLSVRKKLEEALVETARLSALGEMAGGVAHNFNNLLQMILGSADAALARMKSGDWLQSEESVRGIRRAARRGSDIVQRIKDFTHVGEEEGTEGEVFDVARVVRESVELTRPLWQDLSQGGKYDLRVEVGEGYWVKGKPSEICEVLVNLVKNGLEAMPDGGTLGLALSEEDGRAKIAVSDTGKGIPREDAPRIFQPFFTTKGVKSSGLGLSSSFGLVKKHLGEMTVESVPGRGTVFTIALPRCPGTAPAEVASPSPASPGEVRFLVIDDEVNILRSMELFFEGSEVRLMTASTGREGLERFQREAVDVVLCDLGMDDLSGWEVGREILRLCRSLDIPKPPFLLYTGWDKPLDPARLEESGVDRVVVKPVGCEELLGILREAVDGGDRAQSAGDRRLAP